MSTYRRLKFEGCYYFFTVVTYKRQPTLTDSTARTILKDATEQVRVDHPFQIPAFCLLPDHLHCIWKLPAGDSNYSIRWATIKRLFAKSYIAAGGKAAIQSDSRIKKRELGIWQRRFWEHRIRDENDFWNHVHYTYYNPLKHGLVKQVADWPYSTYHRFRKKGLYDDFNWDLYLTNECNNQIG